MSVLLLRIQILQRRITCPIQILFAQAGRTGVIQGSILELMHDQRF